MRALLLSFLLLFIFGGSPAFSQKQGKMTYEELTATKYRSLGIYYSSFGRQQLIQAVDLAEEEGVKEALFRTFGLIYLHSLDKFNAFELGLEYTHNDLKYADFRVPDLPGKNDEGEIKILNVPLSARYMPLDYLFLSWGINVNFDLSRQITIDKLSGIGFQAAAGFQKDFDQGISVFINPYVKTYTILSFHYVREYHALIEKGVRLGVSYNLKSANRKSKRKFK